LRPTSPVVSGGEQPPQANGFPTPSNVKFGAGVVPAAAAAINRSGDALPRIAALGLPASGLTRGLTCLRAGEDVAALGARSRTAGLSTYWMASPISGAGPLATGDAPAVVSGETAATAATQNAANVSLMTGLNFTAILKSSCDLLVVNFILRMYPGFRRRTDKAEQTMPS